jgi:hypothetical protein
MHKAILVTAVITLVIVALVFRVPQIRTLVVGA